MKTKFVVIQKKITWYQVSMDLQLEENNPLLAQGIFLCSITSRPVEGATQPTKVLTVLPPGVKRPEYETNYSPPSSSEIKNECCCNCSEEQLTFTLWVEKWILILVLSTGSCFYHSIEHGSFSEQKACIHWDIHDSLCAQDSNKRNTLY